MERLVALADPVVVPVGRDPPPVVNAGNRARLAQDPELVLALQVVADVTVEDATAVMPGVRVAYQDGDRHRRAGALAEHLAAFPARPLALCPLVPPQVQHPDAVELFRQTSPHPGIDVAVDPRAVGDDGDDALLTDPVRRPPDCHLVGVVQAVLECRRRAGGVGVRYAPLQFGVVHVGVVVRRASLPRRPGRIADDHLNRQLLLALDPLAVVRQPEFRQARPLGVQVEGVGQHDAAEGLVTATRTATAVERLLDVNGRDVIGKQHDLVGVQLLAVLPRQILVPDQPGLQQPDQEDAGAGEGVQNVHARLAQRTAKLPRQDVIGAVEDEVDDFHRRIDDAEPIRILLEGRGEELLVELHQHALARLAVVEAAGAHADAFVEALQVPRLVLQPELPEIPPQGVQGLGHRVAQGKVVPLEQRLEDRPRQDVLRHHFHGVVAGDRLVDRPPELLVEGGEPVAQGVVVGIVEQSLDADNEPRKDVSDILRPGLPVFPVAALVDDLGVDRARRQVERRERQQGRCPVVFVTIGSWTAEDDAVGRRIVQVDLVDLGIEAVVMRAQRAQHAPGDLELLAGIEHPRRVRTRRHRDGQHDVAVGLVRRLAHDAAHGLDDIDDALALRHEKHGVKRRYVDPFGQTAGVRQDAATSPGLSFQPFDARLAVERVVLAVDVSRPALERPVPFRVRQLSNRLLDDAAPVSFQSLRRLDGVGERDRAAERPNRTLVRGPVLRVLQCPPAADDLGRVGDVDPAPAGGQMRL